MATKVKATKAKALKVASRQVVVDLASEAGAKTIYWA